MVLGGIIIKEIIYLDTNLLNSLLAQLNEGLIQNYSEERNAQEANTDTVQNSYNSSGGFNGGIKIDTGFLPGGSLEIKTNKTAGGETSELVSTTLLEGQKDILNKAFHDYSLNKLINDLEKHNLIDFNENYFEGKIYSLKSDFKLYDFELIKRASDTNLLSKLFFTSANKTELTLEEAIQTIGKKTASSEDKAKAAQVIAAQNESRKNVYNYRKSEIFALLGDNLLENTAIVKFNKIMALVNKDNLRISSTILAFTNSSRQAKILFRVISKKNQLFSDKNVTDIESDHFGLLPTVMLDIVLGSLGIVQENNVLVAPIAIYFEEN